MKPDLVTQKSSMPTRKVTAATLAAAAASIVADLLPEFIPIIAAVDQAQLDTLLIGLATLVAGWLVRDRANA